MPTPAIKHDDTRDPREDLAWCTDCQRHYWTDQGGHYCDPLRPARGIINALACSLVIIACIAGAIYVWTGRADAKAPKPIAAPAALLRARAACPIARPLKCRAALRAAYQAISWQRKQNYPGDAAAAITLACHRQHIPCAGFFTVAQCESNMHPLDQTGQYKGLFQLGQTHRNDPIIQLLGWDDPYASALHTARFVKAHGWGQWQCMPSGGLRW